MNKQLKLYAIKLSDEDLYVTQRGGLDELGSRTQLFDKPELAERCLVKIKDGVKLPSVLVHEIVWKILEEKYSKPRWEIDADYKEFGDIQDSLEFQIVEIELNEKKTVKRLRQKRYRAKKTN
nr:MAG TPA: hypothetical protein [Caudoviricetes sp.]